MANIKAQFKPQNKQQSYAERNKERVERLLEKDPAAVKAVIANTIETKKIAANLNTLDFIFSNCRRNVGYSVSFEDFAKISGEYNDVLEAIDKVIKTAVELKVYTPYEKKGESKFKQHKATIVKMLNEKKTDDEIVKAVKEDANLVSGWIKTVQSEIVEVVHGKDAEKEKTAKTKAKTTETKAVTTKATK